MKNNDRVYSGREIEELIKSELADRELTISRQRDKISELKKEVISLQKKMDEIDNREIQVSDAIEKYKSRAQYLENLIKNKLGDIILSLKTIGASNNSGLGFYGETEKAGETLENAIDNLEVIKECAQRLQETEKMSKEIRWSGEGSLEERYHKLLAAYEYNIAEAADTRRGRPKKVEPNVEMLLKRKKIESEKKRKESFDFDEALNPTDSLEKIMKDLRK